MNWEVVNISDSFTMIENEQKNEKPEKPEKPEKKENEKNCLLHKKIIYIPLNKTYKTKINILIQYFLG